MPELSILQEGNKLATIWYFDANFFQQFFPKLLISDGEDAQYSCWVHRWAALLQGSCLTISKTHVELGRVHYPPNQNAKSKSTWLKSLFSALQTSRWCPTGEAFELLQKQRLCHASMSVGDAVQIGRELHFVTLTGFVSLDTGVAAALLEGHIPANLDAYAMDESAVDEHTKDPKTSKKKKKQKGKGENTSSAVENGVHNGQGAVEEARKNRKGQEGKGKGYKEDRSWQKGYGNGYEEDSYWQDSFWQGNSWPSSPWQDAWWETSWHGNSWQANGWEDPPPRGGKGKKGKGKRIDDKVDEKGRGKGSKGDYGSKFDEKGRSKGGKGDKGRGKGGNKGKKSFG